MSISDTSCLKIQAHISHCDLANPVTSSTKDIFEGQVLINKLLIYYSKFEGSREKASRYAQKLLDLGHIESLTNGTVFEDTAHVYRWTDANKVVSETRQRQEEQKTNYEIPKPVVQRQGKHFASKSMSDGDKAVLKISIETEGEQTTEIQANIKTSPRPKDQPKCSEVTCVNPKTVTTIEEDSFFGRRITKTLSYINNEKRGEDCRATTPYISSAATGRLSATMGNEHNSRDVLSIEKEKPYLNGINSNREKNEQHNQISSSPRKKALSASTSPLEIKRALKSNTQDQKFKLISHKSATEPVIAKELSPGANGTSSTISNAQKRDSKTPIINEYKETKVEPTSTSIASTQTSEKSILEASHIYQETSINNKLAERRTPSPAPRSFKRQEKMSTNDDKHTEEKRNEAKAKELQRVNCDKQQKKTRFCREISSASSLPEENSSSSVNDQERASSVNNREMSLHSTGNAVELHLAQHIKMMEKSRPSPSSPPSPSLRVPPASPQTFPLKSLFWTKIPNFETKKRSRRIFWDETVDHYLINEEEFEKLFSKLPSSPQTPRMKIGQTSDNGRFLKVFDMERSRQVSIRASTIRLPIEDIHDAIINMDDDKLDLDALQALCDIRPTPEELDQIADALKARPNAILDKPEQFILMLAMIPNFDERLRCWIFAKKFPDKIVEIQEQLLCLNDVCNQTMQSTTFKKILEIVLILGNRMNQGSMRGDAYGFRLDILPKLKDVKSKHGDTNLLEYVVKVLREQMKLEGLLEEKLDTPRGNDRCGLPELEILNRSTLISLTDLGDDLESQTVELRTCKETLLPVIIKGSTIPAESESFQIKFEDFLQKATEKLQLQEQLYQDLLLTMEDFQLYYMPDSEVNSKENVFCIFRSISDFCACFHQQWAEAKREEIKEEFYKIQRYKKDRQAEIQIKTSPSALKERFLSRRKPRTTQSSSGNAKPSGSEINGHQCPSSSRESTPVPKRTYKFEEPITRDYAATSNGKMIEQELSASHHHKQSFFERANENALRLEKRMKELQLKIQQSNKS